MTTPSFGDRAEVRDQDLIVGLCGPARNLRKELRDWIQQEVIAQVNAADLEAVLREGIIADTIEAHVARLRVINTVDLPEADSECDGAIGAVDAGAYDGMEQAYLDLHKGFDALLRLVRELERARSMISEWCAE